MEKTLGGSKKMEEHVHGKRARGEMPDAIGHQGNAVKAMDGASHVLGWLRCTSRATLNSEENSNWWRQTQIEGRQKERSKENSLQFLRKVNVCGAHSPASQGFTPEERRHMTTQKSDGSNQRGFNHNSRKLETAQMSISLRTDKQTVVHFILSN